MNNEAQLILIDSDDDDNSNCSGGPIQGSSNSGTNSNSFCCRVCGAEKAAMHYGAISCVGCKGFFRRALLKADQLECISNGNCLVSCLQKIQCRSCRFNKCLQEGMNPAFVRPNREVPSKPRKAPTTPTCDWSNKGKTTKSREEWMKKMTVEMRTILMTLMNIETKVMKGDTNIHASKLYPIKGIDKLRELIENSSTLKGKRTEMRYEAYRMASNDELCAIVYRRLIATIDWIDHLSPLLGHLSINDKIALVKNAFAPLMIFNIAAKTVEACTDPDVLCLCNFGFVPRNISKMYSDTYHLGNGLVERILNELVEVYREYGMKEEEIVCVNAMICLNPLAKDISDGLFDKIVTLRNRISDCLFSIVKEVRLSPTPNVCFGHILLSLSTVANLATAMSENLQFAQTFSIKGEIPLLTDLFGCFTVEPFFKEIDEINRVAAMSIENVDRCEVAIQTDRIPPPRMVLKRRKTIDNQQEPDRQNFRLLHPPDNFYITEMFDDLRETSISSSSLSPSSSSLLYSHSAPVIHLNNAAEQNLNSFVYDASSIQPSSSTSSIFPTAAPAAASGQTYQRNCAGPSTSYHFPTPSNYRPLSSGYTPNINYSQLYEPSYQNYIQNSYQPQSHNNLNFQSSSDQFAS